MYNLFLKFLMLFY